MRVSTLSLGALALGFAAASLENKPTDIVSTKATLTKAGPATMETSWPKASDEVCDDEDDVISTTKGGSGSGGHGSGDHSTTKGGSGSGGNGSGDHSTKGGLGSGSGGPSKWSTSTILSTTVYTVTKCPATETRCPVGHVTKTTEIVTIGTTVCPVDDEGKPWTGTWATSKVPGTWTAPEADAFGGTRGHLTLEATVDRTKHDMNWNMPLPSGGNALANDVTLTVDVSLVARTEA
jgi:hypothetical protein